MKMPGNQSGNYNQSTHSNNCLKNKQYDFAGCKHDLNHSPNVMSAWYNTANFLDKIHIINFQKETRAVFFVC